jgi:hypothetical protein
MKKISTEKRLFRKSVPVKKQAQRTGEIDAISMPSSLIFC